MIHVSAAAADSIRGHELSDLEARLAKFLVGSSRPSAEDRPGSGAGGQAGRLAERLLPTRSTGDLRDRKRDDPGRDFPWLLVPRWLAGSFGLSTTDAGSKLLADLCWIQFCVFGMFRAQDDLVDGDVEDPLLAVEANRLMVEASTCAARLFEGDSLYWTVFSDSIDATSRAMVEIDRLQRSPERPPHAELDLYVDLAACLKIAAAGVAVAAGREREWRNAISPALDRVAVAGQILDDVYDIEDDLSEGRINYAAWCLGRPVFGASPEATAAVVASNVATTDRLDLLLAAARELLDEAAELLPPEVCPRTHAYLVDYGLSLGALAQSLEDRRRLLFSEDDREIGRAAPRACG